MRSSYAYARARRRGPLSRIFDKLARLVSTAVMAETESFTIVIEGGAPWGFRLQGGREFRSPLRIAGVRVKKSAAVDICR